MSRTEGRRGAQLRQSRRPCWQSADPHPYAFAGAVPGGAEVEWVFHLVRDVVGTRWERGRHHAAQAGQLVIPDAPGEIDPHPVADADVDPWQSEWFPFDDSALDNESA